MLAMIRLLALAFGSVLLMAVVALGLSLRAPAPAGDSAQARAEAPERRQPRDELVLARDPAGRFHLDAEVNGDNARFLLDTGADGVALTMEDAQRLGIPVDPEALEPIAQTASGVGYGAQVKIERMTVAGEEFFDVDALVIEGLPVNLLGRSLISKIGTLEMQGERMVIKRS